MDANGLKSELSPVSVTNPAIKLPLTLTLSLKEREYVWDSPLRLLSQGERTEVRGLNFARSPTIPERNNMTSKKQLSSPVIRVLKAIRIEPYVRAGDAHHLYAKVTSWPDYRPEMREEYWHEGTRDTDKKSDTELAAETRPHYTPEDLDDYLPGMALARLIYSNVHYADYWRALKWHGRGASYAAIGRRLGCSHTAARNKILKCYDLIEAAALRDEAA